MNGWSRRFCGRAALGAMLAIAAAPFVLGSSEPVDDPHAPGEETRAFKADLIARLASIEPSYHDEEPVRAIGSAQPMVAGRPLRRRSIGDLAAAREESIALRASRRAFEGAPPTMPHSRNFVATKECLDCHLEGMYIAERRAPLMSHALLANCTQCHVEATSLDLEDFSRPVPNGFRGLTATSSGDRPWEGAPPIIPHHLALRSNCVSCHGPNGYPGLKTDHPERMHCLQCHATGAQLEQTSPFHSGAEDPLTGGRREAPMVERITDHVTSPTSPPE